MKITKEDVLKLRERTGVGLMDCKKVLQVTDGDQEKAFQYLKENYGAMRMITRRRQIK